MPDRIVERQVPVADLAPIHLAPVLGARSDGRATVDTSRAMAITVLGEFVRPNDGAVWTRTMLEIMELLGVQPKATRQVLARLAERGWLDRSKQGRNTRWHLTPWASRLLADGAQRIYGFGHSASRPHWDRRWLVVLASLPERDEPLRYRMTNGLTWAGFGSLGQGTWLSPWVDRETAAVDVLAGLGLDGATSFVAEIGALGDGAELAARAWDLDGLAERYREFLHRVDLDTATADASGEPDTTGRRAAADLTALVHHWRRFPFLDPGLPTELLAPDWPGHEAARRFARRRHELLDEASRWWRSAEAAVTAA